MDSIIWLVLNLSDSSCAMGSDGGRSVGFFDAGCDIPDMATAVLNVVLDTVHDERADIFTHDNSQK